MSPRTTTTVLTRLCLGLCLGMLGGPLLAQNNGTQIYQLPQEQPIGGGQGAPGLYPYRKAPPAATIIEQGSANQGIPTTGVQPLPQRPSTSTRSPSYRYYQPHKDGKGTTVVGPDGVTYCRSPNGKLVMCY